MSETYDFHRQIKPVNHQGNEQFHVQRNDDMDLRNVMDVMRKFKEAAPSVGIFWVDEDTRIKS